MKLIKTASGDKTVKISKSEWESIGKKHGWTKEAAYGGWNDILKNLSEKKLEESKEDESNNGIVNYPYSFGSFRSEMAYFIRQIEVGLDGYYKLETPIEGAQELLDKIFALQTELRGFREEKEEREGLIENEDS